MGWALLWPPCSGRLILSGPIEWSMSLLENYHDQDIIGPTVIQVTTVIYDKYIIHKLFVTDFCDQNIIIRELKILCIAHIFFFFLKTNVSLPYWWPGQRTALSPRLGPLPCPWVGNYPGWPVILAQHERVYRKDELLSFCYIAEHDFHFPWSSATFLVFILSVS